jgi:hypothetical protein
VCVCVSACRIEIRYCSGKVLTITVDGYLLVHLITVTMPDAAIEAYKAGLDYTEPTGKNTRKAKVTYEYVVDPNNPHGPPRQRRVIEAGDSGGKLSKWFKGEKTITPVPVSIYLMLIGGGG